MDYNIVRQNASDAYRYGRNNDDRIVGSMINFYKEGKKSPSVASLIMHDTCVKSLQKYSTEMVDDVSMGNRGVVKDYIKKSIDAIRNINKADYSEPVRPYLHEFAENSRNMYPKTGLLRQKLIKTERIVFDTIVPKAGWFTKLKLAKFLIK